MSLVNKISYLYLRPLPLSFSLDGKMKYFLQSIRLLPILTWA